MKKVSVIIPVYNAEKYVEDAVKSVLSQTYENIEILIIDDGSPDKSIEICERFKNPKVKIIRQKNRGLAGARNTGIRHAQGDYLAFLDADDMWLPEKLEKHILHLENSSQIGISFSRSAFINEVGEDLNIYQMSKLTEEKVVEKTRSYAPDIIARCEQVARAYHLRYTVRRLVSLGDGVTAVRLFNQVIANHWRIVLEEPGKTLLTGIAAYLLWFLYPLKATVGKSGVSV